MRFYDKTTTFFLIITILLFVSKTAFAQIQDSVTVKVVYQLSFVVDSTKKDKIKKETHILLAGSENSLVYNNSRFLWDSTVKAAGTKASISQIMTELQNVPHTDLLNNYYIHFYYPTQTFKIVDRVGTDQYFYEDPFESIKWTILPDTMQLLSYSCQKATAAFRGRNYVAWFAKEIPISEGPYKFKGLPGLILRISDRNNNFFFDCIAIEKPVDRKFVDYLTASALKTNRSTFLKLQESDFNYPYQSLESRGVTIGGKDGQRITDMLKMPMSYNPIELE